jgi:hypothetical protein
MTKWMRTAVLKNVVVGLAVLASLTVAGETDSWRMWVPPSPDTYNEYDLSDIG